MLLPYAVLLACPLLVSATPFGAECKEVEYKLGDEYVIDKCSVWTEDPKERFKQWSAVKACLTPLKTRIPIGKSLAENGIEYSCVKLPKYKAKLVKKEVKAVPIRAKRDSAPENLLCKGQYKNGERFTSGSFIKECKSTPTSWSIELVACLTPGKKEILIGSKAIEEGFEYSCIQTENGGARIQTTPCPTEKKENTENMQCDEKYKNGERFESGNFIKECKSTANSWSIVIVACITPGKKEILIGSSVVEEGYEYKCIKTENGARIETTPCPTEKKETTGVNMLCDEKYKNGERFESGNFMKECQSTPNSWSIVIVACLTPGQKEILIGSSADENGLTYSCIKTENGAKIETSPCPKKENPTENLLCKDQYKNGERFTSGNFVKECAATPFNWNLTIVACLSPEKKEILVGESSVQADGMVKYKCVKTENGARIEVEYAPFG